MKKVLEFLLFFFRANGVDPRSQGIVSKILRFITLLAVAFIVTIYILEFLFNWNGVKTLGKVNMFPAILMMMLKTFTLQLKNKDVMGAINMIESFPSHRNFGGDVEERLEKIVAMSGKFTAAYFGLSITVLFAVMLGGIFSDRILYFDAYELCDLSDDTCFYVYFIWQNSFILIFCWSNVISFDCLFIYFVIEAYCAFEITKHMLRNIDVENVDRKKLAEFVKQHDDAMNYVKQLNSIYSMLMLAQCCFSMSALILSLYMITSEGIPPPAYILAKFGFLYVFFAMQFFIYCFGGSVIMEQSQSVAEEAFNVDWCSQTRSELRKSLVMVISRSQRVEKISVGRIMDLNFMCFAMVLNNSFSMYTLLLTVEKKVNH